MPEVVAGAVLRCAMEVERNGAARRNI